MSRRYTITHEWIEKIADDRYRVGISDHAQSSLGDVVYVGIPVVGVDLSAEQNFAVIESVKAASDIYAPVAGKVAAVNDALSDAPETINKDPYQEGWIIELSGCDPTHIDSLLNEADYLTHIKD